jgi:hypothetical protein
MKMDKDKDDPLLLLHGLAAAAHFAIAALGDDVGGATFLTGIFLADLVRHVPLSFSSIEVTRIK